MPGEVSLVWREPINHIQTIQFTTWWFQYLEDKTLDTNRIPMY